MYIRPTLIKYGSFRELTRWGFSSASDGASILGIGSTGCTANSAHWGYHSISIACPVNTASTS